MLRCVFNPEGITLEGMKKVFEKQVFDPGNVPDGVIERRTEVALTQPRHVFETLRVANQAERLGQIQCPTLGFWGTNDLFCPPSGASTLAEGIANCRVLLIGRCGHWVMVEHAELFNDACLEFLSRD